LTLKRAPEEEVEEQEEIRSKTGTYKSKSKYGEEEEDN